MADLESPGLPPRCGTVFLSRPLPALQQVAPGHCSYPLQRKLLLWCQEGNPSHAPPAELCQGKHGTESRQSPAGQQENPRWRLKGHMAQSGIPPSACLHSPVTCSGTLGAAHLLGDLARTLYKLLLGIGIAGATLQGSSLGHQGGAAVTQLLDPALDVGAYLEANGCMREPEGN